ncbi:MAG: beta-propeller domain-containing protein [bacterium]
MKRLVLVSVVVLLSAGSLLLQAQARAQQNEILFDTFGSLSEDALHFSSFFTPPSQARNRLQDMRVSRTGRSLIPARPFVPGRMNGFRPGSLPRFSGCRALRVKLNQMTTPPVYKTFGDVFGARLPTDNEKNDADGHSNTNVQVAGVDEADRIKNDGSYIYLVKGQSVRIVRVWPATGLSELPMIDFSDSSFTPDYLYVDGNKLIVIGHEYRQDDTEDTVIANPRLSGPFTGPSKTLIYPYYYSSATRVIIYDITERTRVREVRNLTFEADYLQSRRVDDTLYLIMNQYPHYPITENTPQAMIPAYTDSTRSVKEEPVCDCDEVSYVPASSDSSYLMVIAIPINDPTKEIGGEIILGAGQNLYASPENLYIAQSSYTAAMIQEGSVPGPVTLVYRFSLNDHDKISYSGQATVPGTIINQFAMDEKSAYFRIATTSRGNVRDEQNLSSSNLYVLDKNMSQVGSIEGIAPGENIKSVRFMGDKAYLVTFLQVDPLFVISLTDPAKPKILGQLKVPGYSEYLHPYDENHLIGFGRDVDVSFDPAKATTPLPSTALLGIQISLFDVTDVEHPALLHKEIIGYRNTDSELLRDHKALLFSKEKNLMAFPATATRKIANPASPYLDYEYIFQGAYFYNLDLTSGFEQKAAITHYDDSDQAVEKAGYFFGGENDIRRIIYIGDYFYTISEGKIKAIDMHTYTEDKAILLAAGGESGV